MKIKSKIERLALEQIENRANRLVSIEILTSSIDASVFLDLENFWASKSPKILIEKSISHVASTLLKEGVDLLDASRPDRLHILNAVKKNEANQFGRGDQSKAVKIKICEWQLLIILSLAEVKINSAQMLIDFCLSKSLQTKAELFGKL